jgi:osmotically-inducible protein OsmY
LAYGCTIVALVLALALVTPPKATLQTATARVPLAISSYCWRYRCSAPFTASRRAAAVTRGAYVTVHLAFLPRTVRVLVGGRSAAATIHGDDVSWRVERGGGLSITATGTRGWVTYVGRLRLR